MTEPPIETFRQRRRAESFGSIAAEYDRYRPPYPDELIRDIAARGHDVLDVGCGTGKAAVLLAGRGARVLGVEVDPAMAEVARRHGLQVEVGAFETWDDGGRSFDVITAAQAWHWVDPELGAAKARRLLRPGGTLALFWNVHSFDKSVADRLELIYRTQTDLPSQHQRGRVRDRDDLYGSPLLAAGLADLETAAYPWQHIYPRDDFTALLATYSDHHLLPAEQRTRLLRSVGQLVDELGGTITLHYETHVLFARAAG